MATTQTMDNVYAYPSDIRDSKYDSRRVTITIMKPHQVSSAGAAYEAAIDSFKKGTDFIVKEAESILDIKANQDASSKAMDGESMGTIVLTLPTAFADAQSHSWSTETGILGTIGANIMKSSPSDVVGKALGKIGGKIGSVGQGIADSAKGISADKMIGAASSAAGLRKPLIDPGYFQNYSGSEPRSFNMTFDLIPNSPKEANDIIMIVMKLKQYSSPSKMVGGVSLMAPYFFNIEISNPYISAMAKFDRVVLKNITIDYGADGSMQQFGDGIPKHMSMNLSWQEVDMTTMEDYYTVPRT
jgi:hypothetical protein